VVLKVAVWINIRGTDNRNEATVGIGEMQKKHDSRIRKSL